MSELELPAKLVNRILSHALQHAARESCGLISAADDRAVRYYAIDNVAADPVRRFEMEPGQQIDAMRHMREHGEELLAIVHSHPQTPPLPSAADIAEAAYPDAYYLIVSLKDEDAPEIRAYRISGGQMLPVKLRHT